MSTPSTAGNTPPHPTNVITAQDLALAISRADELAVLDVRDRGVYAQGHLLFAVAAPYWELDQIIDRLVPRRTTPIVLVDDGTQRAPASEASGLPQRDLAQAAAVRLGRLGYTDIRVLDAGVAAWRAAGFELFTGTNVPGKAFGELIETQLGTPHIDATELHRRLAQGDDVVVVDSRTTEEFADFSIPGAHSLPGAELVYRIETVAPDPDTLIVVNCAGRTRSIVGAQTLINAGIPNPIVSLKDGTMAWLQAGHTLATGRSAPAPAPIGTLLENARQRAATAAARAGVQTLNDAGLARLEAATGSHNLFRFDVRGRSEYEAGHLPGWRWAPGGQLVQASDEYVGVRRARIVLADWDGVRALTTAAWLAQLGAYEVYTYAVRSPAVLEAGPEAIRVLQDPSSDAPWVQPGEAHALLSAGHASVFDIDSSVAFAKGHIAGAFFSAPGSLIANIARHAAGKPVLLTSSDGRLAWSVARTLRAYHDIEAQPILGGTQAWVAAGLAVEDGRERLLTGRDDAWYNPYVYDSQEERDQNFNAYLDWELGLVAQLDRDPRHGLHLRGSIKAPAQQAA